MTNLLVLSLLLLSTLISFSSGSNETRIIGGVDVVHISERPWQVSIQYLGPICSGVIVAPRKVLTAASCVAGLSEKLIQIRFGSIHHNHGGYLIDVAEIVLHPKFDRHIISNNLAMIFTKVPMTSQVVQLALKHDRLKKGEHLEISGWGTKLYKSGILSENLRKAVVPYNRPSECEKAYDNLNIPTINQGTICAGMLDYGGPAICEGDVGGPAYSLDDNLLYGIASFALDCSNSPNKPTVFSDVRQYTNWIGGFHESRDQEN